MDPAYVDQEGSRSRFVDSSRVASPGYFAITLERGNVRAELTSRERVAIHRYTFNTGDPLGLLIDAGHRLSDGTDIVDGAVDVDPQAREVRGFSHFTGGYSERFGGMPVYFVARFDRPFLEHGVWEGTVLTPRGRSALGPRCGAWVTFDPADGPTVRAEVAISFVDLDGAIGNLAAETAGFDFDSVRAETEASWESMLSRARIEARYDYDFRRFYTALYHSLLMPTLATDADGRYRGIDNAIHTALGYRYYTDFSLWDTFRTLHPLLTLLYPEAQLDMLRSLATMARESGIMPRWPLGIGETHGMLGDPAAIVLADSWIKGLTDFDLRSSYDALRASADGSVDGRGNAAIYASLGYVPIEADGASVSETLEFAYADYALAILANALGESADAARYGERAHNWRNNWDAAQGFFSGRHQDGTFYEPFSEESWQNFAEGNARQYVWYVPHDLPGLAELMGGRDALFSRLTNFFEQSQHERNAPLPRLFYSQGNEPDLHAAFIYAELGAPSESARLSRWIAHTFYRDGSRGLPGNDDGGTMSAWLVFATLGLFPIAAHDHYLIVSPIATHAELSVGGGTFIIDAPLASDAAPYVTQAQLDGVTSSELRLPHVSIRPGGRIELSMSATP
jgi:predicted alpha-1,2-mannosidase